MGLQAAVGGLGGGFFLVLAGMLAEVGWQRPFLMYLVALALAPLMLRSLYEPGRATATRRPDRAPTLSPRLLRLALFACLIVGFNQAVFNLVPLQLPFLLRSRLGASSTENGLMIGGLALFFSLGALVTGASGRAWRTFPWQGGAGGDGRQLCPDRPGDGQPDGVRRDVLCGLGLGLFMPNIQLLLANGAPQALRGRLMAVIRLPVSGSVCIASHPAGDGHGHGIGR